MRAVSVESAQRLEMLAGGIFTLCGAALRISASLDVRPVPWESVDGARALTGARNGRTATLDDAGQPQKIVTVGLARGQHTETATWSDGGKLRRRGAGTDAREESRAQVGRGCDYSGLRRPCARHSVPHAQSGQGASHLVAEVPAIQRGVTASDRQPQPRLLPLRRAAMPGAFGEVSSIGRLRAIAQTPGAKVAEQRGSRGRVARLRGIVRTRRPNAGGQCRRRPSAMAKHLTVPAAVGQHAVSGSSV